ncbi:SDR family NAD(P)-dependent oxidoreductase [Nocardioides marmoriginsengisoli]|uniref:2-C-methyl-D-erythritol 4-phosphate cytidylyltransferase n=1 Tax=Nocardioides marmoriginsengisoli TaxID=661483 RepID=A0A3N0CFJ4_9ACTN|nr:bifunctional cytidylyltransferase/SDR family oxidoreductase [Nocardioides marmoriginsengisoli]RNL62232.1 SDR family NAD(P)-dependent oxidoreductase [Nocardioides marmoriginsengisoli]
MSARVAVILAGGVGTRVGLDIPKQLIKVAGHTILEHTLATFNAHPLVDEIIVMMAQGHLDAVHTIVRDGDYAKVTQVLEGAATRNGTTLRALDVIEGDDARVLFHDAVRPLLSSRIITDCFEALDTYDAVDVAIPSADTIIEVDERNVISQIPPRANLRRGQTPQAFRAGVIRAAYAVAAGDPDFQATDDCSVVLKYTPDVPIWVVSGEERNMKVTEPIDVYLADKLFQLTTSNLPPSRSEEEYQQALAGKTMVIFGGSYGIGADIADFARQHGAEVFTFSRSSTNTHVERRTDLQAAIAEVLAKTDHIDFVVNSAAVLPRGQLIETSEETIYAATEINYLAPVMIAQEFHPHLSASRGSLLNFTSSSYTRGRGGYALYSSAKAAVVNLTQALADEWSGIGIRVNCINPERTGTPMRTKAFGEEPAGSLLESVEVARRSIDILLSDQTGLIVDIRRDDPLGIADDTDI